MNSIPVVELHSSTETNIKTTHTTCPYCGVGCGVSATVEETAFGQKLSVAGDIDHPSNYGKLCIKGKVTLLILLVWKHEFYTPCLEVKQDVKSRE